MLIHGVNLKRAVDGNMKPVSGNPLCECFTFAKISETRSLWRGSKSRFGEDPDGWIKWMAEDFMDKYAYSEYTNVVSVKPDMAGDVLETVRHRLESFIRSLVTDMNKGRSWGCSHYSVKNLHRTSGKRGRARAEDGGVSCENGPRGKAPEQTVMDFDQKPKEEKRRTFRKLPILGEPDTPCKSKEETIADIRHWQLENQKILLQDIVALFRDGTGVVKAQDHPALGIGIIGYLGFVVPFFVKAFQRELLVFPVYIVRILIPVPVAVEGHSHHNLVFGNTRLQVALHGSVGRHSSHFAAEERCVVPGRTSHIVGHHVHKIYQRQDGLEINVPCVGGRGQGKEFVRTDGRTDLLHQQGEVPRILRGR